MRSRPRFIRDAESASPLPMIRGAGARGTSTRRAPAISSRPASRETGRAAPAILPRMRISIAAATLAAASALAAGPARADRLSPEDLARKNEGGYVTGLPLFSYSTDIGFGGGARAYYYWNGERSDE